MISDLFKKGIKEADPEVYGTLSRELERQQNQIELIASENIASKSILNAQGSVMTNKYAEGYPGKRYYGGCEFVDQAEEIALERVKKLFNCQYANLQPHSGAQANQAVFLALLRQVCLHFQLRLNVSALILFSHIFFYTRFIFKCITFKTIE